MAWSSDAPFGGFSACQANVCRNLRANNATKANVKVKQDQIDFLFNSNKNFLLQRQEAAGGQTQDSLLKVFRRLAVLRQQNSFLFSDVRTFYDRQKNLFCFVREATGFPGFVVKKSLRILFRF